MRPDEVWRRQATGKNNNARTIMNAEKYEEILVLICNDITEHRKALKELLSLKRYCEDQAAKYVPSNLEENLTRGRPLPDFTLSNSRKQAILQAMDILKGGDVSCNTKNLAHALNVTIEDLLSVMGNDNSFIINIATGEWQYRKSETTVVEKKEEVTIPDASLKLSDGGRLLSDDLAIQNDLMSGGAKNQNFPTILDQKVRESHNSLPGDLLSISDPDEQESGTTPPSERKDKILEYLASGPKHCSDIGRYLGVSRGVALITLKKLLGHYVRQLDNSLWQAIDIKED